MYTTNLKPQDGLVGYWKFVDGQAKDYSENGNDGVIH